MSIYESGENYLESILILSKKQNFVRAIDISEYLGFSKPSVSRAMSILADKDLICINDKGYITLTQKGLNIAENIYERHTFLRNFLISIGVDEKTAESDACKMEHAVSEKSFEAIKKYINNN